MWAYIGPRCRYARLCGDVDHLWLHLPGRQILSVQLLAGPACSGWLSLAGTLLMLGFLASGVHCAVPGETLRATTSSASLAPHAVLKATNSSISTEAACTPQPSVTEAGDHAMSLSDGQDLHNLNTGVVIYPCHAGIWQPAEHQHRIRREDLDLIVQPSVTHVVIGLGMVGNGQSVLLDDAKEAVDELRARSVEVHIASTPDSKDKYNEWLSQEPADSVSALFHTGCL